MLTVHYYSSWNTSDTHVQSTKLGNNNQSSDTACPNAMMQGICGTSSIHDVTKLYCTSVWFVQKLRYEYIYIYYFVWIWCVVQILLLPLLLLFKIICKIIISCSQNSLFIQTLHFLCPHVVTYCCGCYFYNNIEKAWIISSTYAHITFNFPNKTVQ